MALIKSMKQRYHTIIKRQPNGWFVGWVEEVPGTITHGRTLGECRQNLKEALELMLETHRDEARLALDESCIQEAIEIESHEPHVLSSRIKDPARASLLCCGFELPTTELRRKGFPARRTLPDGP